METVVPEIRVVIPQSLRSLCGGSGHQRQTELRIPAHSIRELLAELGRQHPKVHVCVCDERGNPRPHINVFVNDDHVRARAGLDTELTTGDLVTILPAVSGG